MNRERLFKHLEEHYIPKREMISRIPLGVQPDEFWQDVLNRRRSRSISLQMHNPRGIPYWYVVTNKMVAASEQIITEMLENETEFDPYRDTPSASSLEESFFTSYVEGSQISLPDAMAFLQGEREPEEPEEQLILNNRNALSFVGANLFRPVDEEYIRTLAYILTVNMDGGGQEFRLDDCPQIPSMVGIPYELPPAYALQDRVNELTSFLHDPGIHPLIKSGVAQAWALVTRPFPEGNERLARLLSQVILFRAGYVFFSEISLSSLIARSSYAYFNSITNILLPENGADLTYFLEYYMTLLAKGVEERHIRSNQRQAMEAQAEQEMARMPLMQMEGITEEPLPPPPPPEREDGAGESETAKGGDETEDAYATVRERIAILAESHSERLVACAGVLTEFLAQGKTKLTVLDISEAMHLDIDTAGNVISQLKTKDIVKSVGWEDRVMIYAFCSDEEPEPEMENKEAFRETLTQLIGNGHSNTAKGTMILLKYLNDGKETFSSLELQQEAGFNNEQTYRVCYQLKEKGLIVLTGYENERPHYALAFQENEAAHGEPVKPGDMRKNAANHYSKEFMKTIQELNTSARSTKDRRIGTMLKAHLSSGKILQKDYEAAGFFHSFHKDMRLAEQMGLVEKHSPTCYIILHDVRPGPPMLFPTQKEVASAIYQSFGDETFSSEMVVATLDYTHAHVSAVLHTFTLLKILNCNCDGEDRYTYNFLVNPRENPECFAETA